MLNKPAQCNGALKISKTNLYIKGLPEYFNDSLLEQLVPYKDNVKSVKAAMDDESKCKGYGFIDFVNEQWAEEAKQYIETNYSTYPVKFAKENEKDRTNLYVTNLPLQWTSADSDKLKTIFEKYGEVQSAFIMQEKCSNKTTGVGFVRFAKEIDAERAIDDLDNQKMILFDCKLPVEAKYADKHNPDTRRRRFVDTNFRSYPFTMVNGCIGPVDSSINPSLFNGAQIQDFLSHNAMLLKSANRNHKTNLSGLQNTSPYNLIHPYHSLSIPPGLWNVNNFLYLQNETMNPYAANVPNNEFNCGISPFISSSSSAAAASSYFNPLGNLISSTDYPGNNFHPNQSYMYYNNHISE